MRSTDADLELAFHDVLGLFVQGAADAKAGLEAHLVECLRRFLPRIGLHVLWWEPIGLKARRERKGGAELSGSTAPSVLCLATVLESPKVDEILDSPAFAGVRPDFGREDLAITLQNPEYLDRPVYHYLSLFQDDLRRELPRIDEIVDELPEIRGLSRGRL